MPKEDKSVEERLISLEFIVEQINEKLSIYLPMVLDPKRVDKLENNVDHLKGQYSRILSNCSIAKDRRGLHDKTVNDLVNSVNEVGKTQTKILNDMTRFSTELDQIKKEITNINDFIDSLASSGWRLIEKYGPTLILAAIFGYQVFF